MIGETSIARRRRWRRRGYIIRRLPPSIKSKKNGALITVERTSRNIIIIIIITTVIIISIVFMGLCIPAAYTPFLYVYTAYYIMTTVKMIDTREIVCDVLFTGHIRLLKSQYFLQHIIKPSKINFCAGLLHKPFHVGYTRFNGINSICCIYQYIHVYFFLC